MKSSAITKQSKNNKAAQSNNKGSKTIMSCNVCRIQLQSTIIMANCFHIFCEKCGEHIINSGKICPICITKSSFRSIPFPGDVDMLGDMLFMQPEMISTMWAEYYMFLAIQKKHADKRLKEIAKMEEMKKQEANVGNNGWVKSSSSRSSMAPELALDNSDVYSIHNVEADQLEGNM